MSLKKTILKGENRGPAIKSKLKRLTRSSSSKLLAGLPPVRRPHTDNSAEDFATPCKLRLRSPSSTASSPIVLSRNKNIYGPVCLICKKYELVYKK